MEREPGVAAYLLGGLAGPRRGRAAAAAGRAGSRRGAGRADRADRRRELRAARAARGRGARRGRAIAGRGSVRQSRGPPPCARRWSRSRRSRSPASLNRLDDEAAWQARERLFDRCANVVIASLGGRSPPNAPGRCASAGWPGSAARSKTRSRRSYELASAATKSITGARRRAGLAPAAGGAAGRARGGARLGSPASTMPRAGAGATSCWRAPPRW